MDRRKEDIPTFKPIQWLSSNSSGVIIFHNIVFQILRYKSQDSSFLDLVLPCGNVNNYTENYIKLLQKTISSHVLNGLNIGKIYSDEFVVTSFLTDLQERMKEIVANNQGKNKETLDNSFSNLRTVIEFEAKLADRVTKRLKSVLQSIAHFFNVPIWVDEGLVYRIEKVNQKYFEDSIEQIIKIMESTVPEFLSSGFAGGNIFNTLHFRFFSRLFFKEYSKNKNFKNLAQIKSILDNMRLRVLKPATEPIHVSAYLDQFYDEIGSIVSGIKDLLIENIRTDSQTKEITTLVREMSLWRSKPISNFHCGPFEIVVEGDKYLLGMHTGKYIIEDCSTTTPRYYFFEDAFVAVPLSKSDIIPCYKGESIPPPIVVNTYGPHPFLSEPWRAKQPICFGDTNLNGMNDAWMPMEDRVMNVILMGVKIMREGHNSQNANTYYHSLSENIFENYLLPARKLKKHQDVFISKYYRKDY